MTDAELERWETEALIWSQDAQSPRVLALAAEVRRLRGHIIASLVTDSSYAEYYAVMSTAAGSIGAQTIAPEIAFDPHAEAVDTPDHGGDADTPYSFAQCPACGAFSLDAMRCTHGVGE